MSIRPSYCRNRSNSTKAFEQDSRTLHAEPHECRKPSHLLWVSTPRESYKPQDPLPNSITDQPSWAPTQAVTSPTQAGKSVSSRQSSTTPSRSSTTTECSQQTFTKDAYRAGMTLGSGYLNGHKKGCLILVFSVSMHLAILRLAFLLFYSVGVS